MEYLTFENEPLSYATNEELNTLRNNLLLCGDDKRVILLTSTVGGEGKSTITFDLARSLCELGKTVLLVDCDLRKSKMSRRLTGGSITKGLTHYLAGRCRLDSATYLVEGTRLTVMPAGTVPPNPTELLANQRMAHLLEEGRESFDYVLLDTPPLGMVVDAAVLAPHCDGAIMLIESGGISYRYAQEVTAKLRSTRCPILGVVLNKIDLRKNGYYGHYGQYGKYYRYEGYQ